MKIRNIWFEIPVEDFGRAKEFYNEIFQIEMEEKLVDDLKVGFFPMDGSTLSGAIVEGKGYIPVDKGSLIYLNAGDDLQEILSRIEPAGGKILLEKELITEEIGYKAVFLDTEGNRLALQSKN
jgi:uncharacterized protein